MVFSLILLLNQCVMTLLNVFQIFHEKYPKKMMAWNDIYNDSLDVVFNTSRNSQLHIGGYQTSHVCDSNFFDIHTESHGGSIYHSSGIGSKMLIEMCTFYNSSSTGHGGAIAMFTGGNCAIRKCCGRYCFIASEGSVGEFIYNWISEGPDIINYFLDSSVSHAMENTENTGNSAGIWLEFGVVVVDTVNSSYSVNNANTGLYLQPLSNTMTCTVKFTSINHNIALSSGIVYFSTSEKCEILYSNIINNEDRGTTGMIYVGGQGNIQECCILNNSANCLIYGASSTYVIHCTIDAAQNIRSKVGGNVNVDKWYASTWFVIPIVCTENDVYCLAALDSVNLPQPLTFYGKITYTSLAKMLSILIYDTEK